MSTYSMTSYICENDAYNIPKDKVHISREEYEKKLEEFWKFINETSEEVKRKNRTMT